MTRTVKIPKKIAGVKVPKRVRKRAKKAIEAGASPVVREIAAAALGAAAAKAGCERRFEGRARVGIDGAKLGEAVRSAAIDGLRRFLEGLEEGLRNAKDKSDDPQPEPQAKPKAAKKAKAKAAKSRRPAAKPGSRAPGV
jgi:hypothetical protein